MRIADCGIELRNSEVTSRDRSDGPLVLAIETSCDETAVALLRGRDQLLVSKVASQSAIHNRYGGVVPEVASRNHLIKLLPLVESALAEGQVRLADVECIAATRGPGLLTSLLVGYAAAKGFAIGLRKPFIGVNHLEAHLLSPFFNDPCGPEQSVGLIVSGGHTQLVAMRAVGHYKVLGSTLDDAAGEAFDKVGKLLGLPYPGGPNIERWAERGDATRFDLPRGMWGSGDFNFSFSGLKTAVRYLLPKLSGDYQADLCASFQEAVIQVLVRKTIAAAQSVAAQVVTVSGGVSCNLRLRREMESAAAAAGIRLRLAAPALTTDNAAMIAFVASEHYRSGSFTSWIEDADPNLKLV
ncbi:MAG TPA: tRNA (adenosine(37)-N6)-threonylcarbamoyltransferase complex transferase subunit TsaD [Chthoniobacterales bacterium]|nr:tRNA (adenosine(37)-N6)-threonylcarbamoyltransferase complex transferase subunit TsaD [Chthoniobacterales bacterium]